MWACGWASGGARRLGGGGRTQERQAGPARPSPLPRPPTPTPPINPPTPPINPPHTNLVVMHVGARPQLELLGLNAVPHEGEGGGGGGVKGVGGPALVAPLT